LENCVNLPIVNFTVVGGTEFESISDLSSDQQYFLDILIVVSTGNVKEGLESRSPGKLVQSRWLTLANHVLRLYIATTTPTETLHLLVKFIVRSYALVWFSIKFKPMIWNAAHHFFLMIKSTRFLPPSYREIVDRVLIRNAYPAHRESILLAMLKDTDLAKRKLAVDRILKARQENILLRQYCVPQINLEATSYDEMIHWESVSNFEPVLTKSFSNDTLENILTDANITVPIPALPCHNQNVERMVQLVSLAAKSVAGHDNRDGFIRARLQKRQIMPVFDTKKQFREYTGS